MFHIKTMTTTTTTRTCAVCQPSADIILRGRPPRPLISDPFSRKLAHQLLLPLGNVDIKLVFVRGN